VSDRTQRRHRAFPERDKDQPEQGHDRLEKPFDRLQQLSERIDETGKGLFQGCPEGRRGGAERCLIFSPIPGLLTGLAASSLRSWLLQRLLDLVLVRRRGLAAVVSVPGRAATGFRLFLLPRSPALPPIVGLSIAPVPLVAPLAVIAPGPALLAVLLALPFSSLSPRLLFVLSLSPRSRWLDGHHASCSNGDLAIAAMRRIRGYVFGHQRTRLLAARRARGDRTITRTARVRHARVAKGAGHVP
jgi:hypothetical protein